MTTYAPPAVIVIPWTQPFATVGTWSRFQALGYLGGGSYFNGGSQNDSVSYRVALGVGTYTFTMIGRTNTNTAISTVALDGTSIGTLDWYAADAINTVKTITGIVVTTPGVYTLSLTSATKNASSSAYYQVLQLLALHRTDDASGPIVGATLPHRVDIVPWAGTQYASSTTVTAAQASTLLSGGSIHIQTSQNNYAEWLVPLAAGTWSVTTVHNTFTDAGISDVSLNGVSLGTFDQYSAGNVQNVVAAVTGATVAQAGIYKLRFTAATKHASSSAYRQRLQHIVLQRTGA